MTETDRLLTPDKVARILDLSTAAVIRRLRTGVLSGFKLHQNPDCDGSCHCPWRVHLTSVAGYLARMDPS